MERVMDSSSRRSRNRSFGVALFGSRATRTIIASPEGVPLVAFGLPTVQTNGFP